ncbi:MAG: hypothetical protein Q4A01_03390 [Coriobacteriales bacterium]|nr:hypothetical protein [Coriobacteriales bacterium]
MPVKVVPLTCPNCGGRLEIPTDLKQCFCTYCGTRIAIDDGSVTIHVHNYDEAELRRIELENERHEQEEREEASRAKKRKVWRIALLAYIAITLLMAAISGAIKSVLPVVYDGVSTLMAIFLIVGAIALFLQRPGKKAKRG